jgi:tetraacyldisaccharide 4'-kinase
MSRLALYLHQLWHGSKNGVADRFLLLLLTIPSLVYSSIMQLRAWCYRQGFYTTDSLPKPVISVGNITVGGTGKTPVTAWIARYLLEKGLRVAVLSRGYGGSLEGQTAVVSDGQTVFLKPDQCGDEPYLLANTVPGLAVVIGSNRYKAGLLAMERVNPDLFLLDDGFQHIRLFRNLNILLLDWGQPFGNGRVLPAGPLREPIKSCLRAELLVYTRCTTEHKTVRQPETSLPVCHAGYRLTTFRLLDSGQELQVSQLSQERILAVAGIARPDSFFAGLGELGLQPCATLALPDHEPYTVETVRQIEQLVTGHGATCLVTTEKDGVKLESWLDSLGAAAVVATLALDFYEEQLLRNELDKVLSK